MNATNIYCFTILWEVVWFRPIRWRRYRPWGRLEMLMVWVSSVGLAECVKSGRPNMSLTINPVKLLATMVIVPSVGLG